MPEGTIFDTEELTNEQFRRLMDLKDLQRRIRA